MWGFSFGRFCCCRLILDYQVPVGIGRDATELNRLERRYRGGRGKPSPTPTIPRPCLESAAPAPRGAFLLLQCPAITQPWPLVRVCISRLNLWPCRLFETEEVTFSEFVLTRRLAVAPSIADELLRRGQCRKGPTTEVIRPIRSPRRRWRAPTAGWLDRVSWRS